MADIEQTALQLVDVVTDDIEQLEDIKPADIEQLQLVDVITADIGRLQLEDVKQLTGLNRNTIDKYYTKKNIVEQCVVYLKTHINITKEDLIIEPSAGNGAFIDQIKMLSDNYAFYDLEPENEQITKQDFLELNHATLKDKTVHIIGNPPFGRQSSAAIKFIKKCCEFSNSISFILPKSFKKESMRKHFTNNFHLLFEIDI
jgi:predicted RNA methylase